MREHDVVVLKTDLAGARMRAGDVGAIVHIHGKGEAFEVEFVSVDGSTSVVATALASQVRPVDGKDMIHARPMEAAA